MLTMIRKKSFYFPLLLLLILLNVTCSQPGIQREVTGPAGELIFVHEKFYVDFKHEGTLYLGTAPMQAGKFIISPLEPYTYLLCLSDNKFSVISNPTDLKLAKPKIENEKDALTFVRLFTTIKYHYLFKGDGAFLEIEKKKEGGICALDNETWDRLGLQPVTVRKEGEYFIIERNVFIDEGTWEDGQKIIRSLEKVGRTGEYSYDLSKVIIILQPPEKIFTPMYM